MTDVPRSPETLPDGLTRVRAVAQRWVDSALDLVFPPRCVHCTRTGSLLCQQCASTIQPSPANLNETEPLAGRRATGVYDGALESAIKALKYRRRTRLATLLAERLANELRHTDWNVTVITAVPLHPDRLRERGYNQSTLLAEQLAAAVGIPFQGAAVRRIRNTRPQVGLDARDRLENVTGAFEAEPAIAAEQRVLLIDDVYTTGATMRACADALRQAGAARVWALTLASAHRKDHS